MIGLIFGISNFISGGRLSLRFVPFYDSYFGSLLLRYSDIVIILVQGSP